MIKGLYETHLFVENLEVSIDFYKNILGLQQCNYVEERRVAFFWIGKPQEAMLGLWEKPKSEIDKRHFAFRCDSDDILFNSVSYLRSRNLKPYNFLKDGTEKPMVFAWMPAIAIYFDDPDGHALEFISVLNGKPKPELGVISYEDWMHAQNIAGPNFEIVSSGNISKEFIQRNIYSFQNAMNFIREIPYGRNKNKNELLSIFSDGCATCSTKHAILKQLAIENDFSEIQLILVLYKMNGRNTPEVSAKLNQFELEYIPEAHCYLKYQNEIIDCTKTNSDPSRYVNDIIEEMEITPEQISVFKNSYHQNYLKQWLIQNSNLKFDFENLWSIREQCIQDLATFNL